MGALVEIPVCAHDGTPRGDSVLVEAPPPEVWHLGAETLELRRFREAKRFGCGCIWDDRLGYVHRREAADGSIHEGTKA